MSQDELSFNFIEWLHQHKFQLANSKVQTKSFPDAGRGLQAVCDLASGDMLLQVPRSLLMSPLTSLNCLVGCSCNCLLQDIIPGDSRKRRRCQLLKKGTDVLSVFLFHEWFYGELSKYAVYLHDYLPKEYGNFLYFSKLEMETLSSDLKYRAQVQLNSFNQLLHRLLPSLRGIVKEHYYFVNPDDDMDDCDKLIETIFRWCWSTVNSRCVHCTIPPGLHTDTKVREHLQGLREPNVLLVPFFDLVNHDGSADAVVQFSVKLDCFELITQTAFKKGSQVFINYGPHDNASLLTEYGFTLPVNPHDCVHVTPDQLARATSSLLDTEPINACLDLLGCWKHSTEGVWRSLCVCDDGPSFFLLICLEFCSLNQPDSLHLTSQDLLCWDEGEMLQRQADSVLRLCALLRGQIAEEIAKTQHVDYLTSERICHVQRILKGRLKTLEKCRTCVEVERSHLC